MRGRELNEETNKRLKAKAVFICLRESDPSSSTRRLTDDRFLGFCLITRKRSDRQKHRNPSVRRLSRPNPLALFLVTNKRPLVLFCLLGGTRKL